MADERYYAGRFMVPDGDSYKEIVFGNDVINASSAALSAEIDGASASLHGELAGTSAAIEQEITGTSAALDAVIVGTSTALHNEITGTSAALDGASSAIIQKLNGTSSSLHTEITGTSAAIHTEITGTSSALNQKISQLPKFRTVVVSSLPSTGDADAVYLLSGGTSTGNLYTEYIYVNNAWEILGTQEIDLSNYVQKETGKGLSTNDYTTTEKNKLAGIENNANNYTLPAATKSAIGGVKLYDSTGSATDGAMTQNAVTEQLSIDNLRIKVLDAHMYNGIKQCEVIGDFHHMDGHQSIRLMGGGVYAHIYSGMYGTGLATYKKNLYVTVNMASYWDDAQYATAANRAGKDVYIYAVYNKDDCILSLNSTAPSGYNQYTSTKVGGFHCLCADVGTIDGHTLTGYKAGDILFESLWWKDHRPVSDPEGMVFIKELNLWVDIYLASWDGSKLASKYGATIADGESSEKFHGLKFVEEFGKIGKRLLTWDEFMVVAKGSNEGTNIKGSADPNTTGGHVDTASRRMISHGGIEDCCGAYWQWSATVFEHYATAENKVSYYDGKNTYMQGYAWGYASIYNSVVDSQKYGGTNGLVRRAILGGYWALGANCGSRCVACDVFAPRAIADLSARGASEPRIRGKKPYSYLVDGYTG